MNRIALHLLSIGAAFLLSFSCVVVATPLAMASGSGLTSALAACAGVGWMVGGLIVNKKYLESGPLLLFVGAAVLGWLLEFDPRYGSALNGLFELQLVWMAAAVASWFVLRDEPKARRLTMGFAVVIFVVISLLLLQERVPGRATVLVDETGAEEAVVIAHPLSDEWKSTHGAHSISRAGDAIYVWRDSPRAMRRGAEPEVMRYAPDLDNRSQLLTKLTASADIDAAYGALWETEEWLLAWEVARDEVPFFMPVLACLRGEWRRGSVWKAEPVNHW